MGSLSPLEALRAILSVVGLLGAIYGFLKARDGSMAFPRAIRKTMIRRRRVQMAVYASLFVAFLIGAGVAGLTEGAWPPDRVTVVTNIAILYAIGMLTWLQFHQVTGWIDFERIIGEMPLAPESDGKVNQTSQEAREIMHEINGRMSVIIGEVHYMMVDPGHRSDETLEDIDQALRDLQGLQAQAHILIRSLSATQTSEESTP